MTAVFPSGLDTHGCGNNTEGSTAFPAWDTAAGAAPKLGIMSWRANALDTMAIVLGLGALSVSPLDSGPVVAFQGDDAQRTSLVWSTLDHHKIVVQTAAGADGAAAVYSMGVSAAIPQLPVNWSYSVVFSVATGGATAAVYSWGSALQQYYGTRRLPSLTLSNIGYYTDDGAYYYVWEAFNISARPWPAQEGLALVKESLHAAGVPVAYMQLDDWWYSGPFYFGNVKAVVDWHASNASRLFPDGLPAFAQRLGIELQLYTPFWSDAFSSPYAMTGECTWGAGG
jgi:hypothetical protein